MKILNTNWIYGEEEGRIITHATIEDNSGVTWTYDQEAHRQIRNPWADIDSFGTPNPDNGYLADSFDEAILILVEGGYI